MPGRATLTSRWIRPARKRLQGRKEIIISILNKTTRPQEESS